MKLKLRVSNFLLIELHGKGRLIRRCNSYHLFWRICSWWHCEV